MLLTEARRATVNVGHRRCRVIGGSIKSLLCHRLRAFHSQFDLESKSSTQERAPGHVDLQAAAASHCHRQAGSLSRVQCQPPDI